MLIRMLRFCFLHLNLVITVSFFFKRWHASRSSRFTSWLVRDNALQMLLSRTSSTIVARTGFISSDSRQWYWALLTAFSNWTIFSLSNQLQFLLTVNSEERISYCLRKSLKWLVRSDSLEDMPSTLTRSSINFSDERFSSWLLVQTIMIYEYRWYNIKIKLN